ncbi:hypothetical protein JCM8097_008244 [Rhodosporidiobolus ruineniae]
MPPLPVINPAPAALPSVPSLSLLPFALAHDGPAPIARFFQPRPYPDPAVPAVPDAPPPKHRQAAFRGRRVVSSTLKLPHGLTGVVFASPAPAAIADASAATADEDAAAAQDAEREERAAKRAKRAVEAAAALEAAEDDGASGRRSPRKAVRAARERAVEKAREKARKAKEAVKGKKGKGGFSLDDEDEEDGADALAQVQPMEDQTREAAAEEAMLVEEENLPGVAVDAAPAAVESTVTEAGPEAATTALAAEEPAANPHPLAPLPTRTLSSASSSAPHISSTPLSTSASVSAIPLEDPFNSLPVTEEVSSTPSRDLLPLRPLLTFNAIEVWNADFPIAGGNVQADDDVGRVVAEWMAVAAKIHAY